MSSHQDNPFHGADGAPSATLAGVPSTMSSPITEADLHAFADHRLSPGRRNEVELFLASRPDEQQRVRDWEQQNAMLRDLLDPVLGEPLPLRLPLRPDAVKWPWRGVAAAVVAGIAIAVVSGGAAWVVRGKLDDDAARLASSAGASAATSAAGATDAPLTGFAHRAAVAHVVYSPDVRRPVELGSDQEQALVTWLTKRMGAAVRAPALGTLGYELIGGRLLPGGSGPVAQFMYGSANGQRLTLYVTREVAGQDAGFKFAKDGPVNVFYWVDEHFGYAISAGADKDALMKVSQEVYRQLK